MSEKRCRQIPDSSRHRSPWALSTRLLVGLWHVAWMLFFRPTPKPFARWRLLLLRLFGCRIAGRPFVASSAVIKMPWNLILEDKACIGSRSDIYNLAPVTLKRRCVVAQEAYLCTGTHEFSDLDLPLVVGEITIGEDAFVGARAFVLPGVVVGEGAVVGACSVVSRDVEPWTVVAGNPARHIKTRECKGDQTGAAKGDLSQRAEE